MPLPAICGLRRPPSIIKAQANPSPTKPLSSRMAALFSSRAKCFCPPTMSSTNRDYFQPGERGLRFTDLAANNWASPSAKTSGTTKISGPSRATPATPSPNYQQGTSILLNISASPYTMISVRCASKCSAPSPSSTTAAIIYVNQVGGDDSHDLRWRPALAGLR